MQPHAFISMPFGSKPDPAPGADGKEIHFDRIYQELLGEALRMAGFSVFRADDEQRAGDIRADMFQELLMADLVLVDITLDNPNVWYELGVRDALRDRGAVLVHGPRVGKPFNIYSQRKLQYHVQDGAPDPAFLHADRQNLCEMIRQTHHAASARKVSPVYSLLPHLQEPKWRDLLLGTTNEFSQRHQAWEQRVKIARGKHEVGDLLVLADEAPIVALKSEACRATGNALMDLQQYHFALEQFEAALAIDPNDKTSLEKRTVCLGRVGKREEARQAAMALVRAHPKDPEAHALYGRIEKEGWIARWQHVPLAERRAAAEQDDATLAEALEHYVQAFKLDARHFYSGINALTLSVLRRELGGLSNSNNHNNQPAIGEIAGGVRWAVECELTREPRSYWARVSLAEYTLVNQDMALAAVIQEYKHAVAVANKDRFALDSSRQTVSLLAQLRFRPAESAAALAILDKALSETEQRFVPRKVFLFSGHMVDAPDRAQARFPQAKVAAATSKMEEVLDQLGAATGDLALTQGAAGGDLIFAEACAARGVRVRLLQPFAEAEFIAKSILPSQDGQTWRRRFFQLKDTPGFAIRHMPDELGPVPEQGNPFARCNLWLLGSALAYGIEKVHFICLWNGAGGDGSGGTEHMYQEVARRTGQVSWIDARQL